MSVQGPMWPIVVFAQVIELAGPLHGDSRTKNREEDKPEQISVRSKPPARSASDWEVDHETIASVPHETGADVLGVLPGVFVSNRGMLGQAPHLSLRGFEGTSGQDVEVFVGNIPMNQASNIRAPGYADMRLVMPEVIRSVRVSHGPYDPRQGDFAIAGSTHMDLGLQENGFWAKGTAGSFGARRLYLAFAPVSSRNDQFQDSFAAFETYGIDGPGGGRSGERSSFVGQFAWNGSSEQSRIIIAIGSARFDFPGLLPQEDVARGEYPYDALRPLGRDRTTQAHLGLEQIWEIGDGTLTIGGFVSKTKMQLHQNLTGYALDALAGLPPTNADDFEQVNDASTYGLTAAYRHRVDLVSDRDLVEVGVGARIDSVDQSDTRLNADGTVNSRPIDATVGITNIHAYVDASLYPIRRVVVRGGTRLDSLSYSITDHTQNQGVDRTAQGFHVGNKATIDYAAGGGVHLVASYGEGFRSPQARDLAEGQKIPFAVVQSGEVGVRVKSARVWQASLVGFGSWLDQDRVFDPLLRQSIAAPSSSRLGGAAAIGGSWGPFGTSASATYARAVFTGSDASFHEGDRVPYAPSFVVREDTYVVAKIGSVGAKPLTGRLGVGLQGAAGQTLPDGRAGRDVFYVDALASLAWRAFELSLNGMNLLSTRYYDVQYLYPSNFQRSPTLPAPAPRVLVAPPASVFATLQVHIDTPDADRVW